MKNNGRNEQLNKHNMNKEELKKMIEKQIELAVWLQAVGQVSEAYLLSILYKINENPESHGEKTLVTGAWVQATGQLLEALGVSREISADLKVGKLEGQNIVVTGDLLQGIGGLIAAIGGSEIITEENQAPIEFIP